MGFQLADILFKLGIGRIRTRDSKVGGGDPGQQHYWVATLGAKPLEGGVKKRKSGGRTPIEQYQVAEVWSQ